VTIPEDIQEVRLGLGMLAGSTGYEYEDDREQAEKSLAALERLETRLLAAEQALREWHQAAEALGEFRKNRPNVETRRLTLAEQSNEVDLMQAEYEKREALAALAATTAALSGTLGDGAMSANEILESIYTQIYRHRLKHHGGEMRVWLDRASFNVLRKELLPRALVGPDSVVSVMGLPVTIAEDRQSPYVEWAAAAPSGETAE
jgi:hypothetical protein